MEKIDRIPKCKDDPFQAIHRMGDKINELVDAVNELIGNDNRCLNSGHITDGQRMKCDYCGEWVQMKAQDPRKEPECEDCRTLRMRRASMDEKSECKHEWARYDSPTGISTVRCKKCYGSQGVENEKP